MRRFESGRRLHLFARSARASSTPAACTGIAFLLVVLGLAACDVALSAQPREGMKGVMQARLPEERGLAAQYPRDVGLAKDPSVVLVDDFEAFAAGTVDPGLASSAAKAVWDRAWGAPRITEERTHVHAGQRAIELRRTTPGAVGVLKSLSPGFDRLFLRYYLKYDDAFPGAHHVGGALQARASGVPDANPGVRPDGVNQFDALLDHWTFDPLVTPPGHLVAYVYHLDQQHQWGEQFYPSGKTQPGVNGARGIFGPSFVPRQDLVPVRGRWYCFELMVQANTPGQRDGRVAFWVDGRLTADFPNLRFRTVDALKLNRVGVGLYESRRIAPQRVWVDDVVLATAYIGPMTPDR